MVPPTWASTSVPAVDCAITYSLSVTPGGIQEHEVEQLNRRFQRRGRKPIEPIYTAADAEDCLRQFSKVRYGDWVQVTPDVRARWWDAGHILGSAIAEVTVQGPEQRKQLEENVENQNLTHRVTFIGEIPRIQVIAELKAAEGEK